MVTMGCGRRIEAMILGEKRVYQHETIDGEKIVFPQTGDLSFASCVIKKSSMYNERMGRVFFEQCLLENIDMRRSVMNGVFFRDCILKNVDFSRSDMTYVSFTDCELFGCDFSCVNMQKVLFRGNVTLQQTTLAED